jgi:hypothetical protein
MGEAGRVRIENLFSPTASGDRFAALVNRVVAFGRV